MTEPIITCPKCKTEIKLTESLAAPLIESTRREFDQRLIKKMHGEMDRKRERFINEIEGKMKQATSLLHVFDVDR